MTKKAYLKIPFNVLFERDRKKTVTALFHLFPCRAIFCHPSHSQGLDAGAWKTAAAAITPSNFTYALHNGEKGKKSGMMAITYHSVRMQIIQMDKDNRRNQSTFNANVRSEIKCFREDSGLIFLPHQSIHKERIIKRC